MKRALLIILQAIIMTACVPHQPNHNHHHNGTNFAPHYSDSLFQVTAEKKYSIELRLKDGPLAVGENKADIIVHKNAAQNVDAEGVTLTITPWMTAMGHGVPRSPQVTERGAGLYTVDNIWISMTGSWELKIKVSGEAGQDTAVFVLPVGKKSDPMGQAAQHHHDHTMMEDSMKIPAGSDMSTDKASANGLYRVSFTADIPSITINKIHSWTLKLTTRDGQPLTDAKIKVNGNMPAHGHGLPTRPKISATKEPGVYLVRGMKFNMPGFWIVNFSITHGGEKDAATFNLMVI